MKQYTISPSGARSFKFTGEVIATANSSPNNAHPSYSGSVGRWKELTLYKTAGGKYVCVEFGCTQWQGEHTKICAEVVTETEGVIEFFGSGWLAKELYVNAGIDDAVEVE